MINKYFNILDSSKRCFCIIKKINSHNINWIIKQQENFIHLLFLDISSSIYHYCTFVFKLLIRTINKRCKEGLMWWTIFMWR